MLRGASGADSVVVLDELLSSFQLVNPWEESSVIPWDLELPIDELDISPDGAGVALVMGGRVLRIPVTKPGCGFSPNRSLILL